MTKLGTSKKPAVVRVGTEARAQEILRICKENDWQVIVGIEPDKPENISDVKWLLNRRKMEPTSYTPKPAKVGANDYCPWGSGLKYKNCCLRREEGEKRNGP